jgi:hypothetical protein
MSSALADGEAGEHEGKNRMSWPGDQRINRDVAGGLSFFCTGVSYWGSLRLHLWLSRAFENRLLEFGRPYRACSTQLGCFPRAALRLPWAILGGSLRERMAQAPKQVFKCLSER